MNQTLAIILFVVLTAVLALVLEILLSLIGLKYKEYKRVDQLFSFWTWVHFSWDYVGGRPAKRHVGVRWFGFSFGATYVIPDGELRF